MPTDDNFKDQDVKFNVKLPKDLMGGKARPTKKRTRKQAKAKSQPAPVPVKQAPFSPPKKPAPTPPKHQDPI